MACEPTCPMQSLFAEKVTNNVIKRETLGSLLGALAQIWELKTTTKTHLKKQSEQVRKTTPKWSKSYANQSGYRTLSPSLHPPPTFL